jgi:exosortase/archaeosortase family protein
MKQKVVKKQLPIQKWLSNPFFQFIGISSILLVILMLYVSQAAVDNFFVKGTTVLLDHMLHWFHFKTRLTGNFILLLDGSQIKLQIIQDCTGVYPFIILTSLMAGFPVHFIKKLVGIGLALVYTFIFNYLRLVLLFAIGRHSEKWFEIAHIFIWQVSFVLLIVIFFFWWVQWAKKINKKISRQ